jgi:hypothetical protein
MDTLKRGILRSGLAGAIGIVAFSACSHVGAVHEPLAYMRNTTPIEVWVVRRHNDTIYRMSQPRLQGDTLIGFLLPRPGAPLTQYEEIPLNDVRQMRARQGSPLRTAVLIAGIGGIAFVSYHQFVGGGSKNGTPTFCECDFDDFCGC